MNDPPHQPPIAPDEYARLVRDASDDDLRAGLRVNGAPIVEEIFRAMPALLDEARAEGVRLVADWRIRLPDDAGDLRWQVAIEDGRCTVERDGAREPHLTFRIRGLDFVKLVTGNARGPLLFVLGRLKIDGDLLAAARYPTYFRMPTVPERDS